LWHIFLIDSFLDKSIVSSGTKILRSESEIEYFIKNPNKKGEEGTVFLKKILVN
jgi:hypothetical protein